MQDSVSPDRRQAARSFALPPRLFTNFPDTIDTTLFALSGGRTRCFFHSAACGAVDMAWP